MPEIDSLDCRKNKLQVLAEVAKALTVPLSLCEPLEAVMSKIDDALKTVEFGILCLPHTVPEIARQGN